MEGWFAFGGLVGGFGGKTVTGKPFQAKFTITRTETLPNNSITNTITGTVARDTDGSTYRDVKLPAIGPWASSGEVHEFIYIKNLTTKMAYLVNVAKGTYREFSTPSHGPKGGNRNAREGLRRGDPKNNESVTDNPSATYTDPGTGANYKVDDKKVTWTIPAGQIGNQNDIVITTERWYSTDMDLLMQETRSDPRFGTSAYQLTHIGAPNVSFTPDPSMKLSQGAKFGGGLRHGGAGVLPPPAQD
jgi:hypothetical protein